MYIDQLQNWGRYVKTNVKNLHILTSKIIRGEKKDFPRKSV